MAQGLLTCAAGSARHKGEPGSGNFARPWFDVSFSCEFVLALYMDLPDTVLALGASVNTDVLCCSSARIHVIRGFVYARR